MSQANPAYRRFMNTLLVKEKPHCVGKLIIGGGNRMVHARVVYYTEAMCPWCWGIEPAVRYIQVRYPQQLEWELRTGGLRENVEPGFDRERAEPREPDEVEEAWEELAGQIEMPLNPTIYRKDPPGPPNAGCYAVKAAQLQRDNYGEAMARLIREGTFLHEVNMAKIDNLLGAAARIEGLNVDRFRDDLGSKEVRQAFYRDWESARTPAEGAPDTKAAGDVERYAYPTFEFYSLTASEPIEVLAYLDPGDYEQLDRALDKASSDLEKVKAPELMDLFGLYPTATTREVAVCCELSMEEAFEELNRLRQNGVITVEEYGEEPWAALWKS
jgi:predicted DsbA family dithiol-disulfide isomerase